MLSVLTRWQLELRWSLHTVYTIGRWYAVENDSVDSVHCIDLSRLAVGRFTLCYTSTSTSCYSMCYPRYELLVPVHLRAVGTAARTVASPCRVARIPLACGSLGLRSP